MWRAGTMSDPAGTPIGHVIYDKERCPSGATNGLWWRTQRYACKMSLTQNMERKCSLGSVDFRATLYVLANTFLCYNLQKHEVMLCCTLCCKLSMSERKAIHIWGINKNLVICNHRGQPYDLTCKPMSLHISSHKLWTYTRCVREALDDSHSWEQTHGAKAL